MGLMEQVKEDVSNAEEARQNAIDAQTVLATTLSALDNIGYTAIQVNRSATPTTEESQVTNETKKINEELFNEFPSLMDGYVNLDDEEDDEDDDMDDIDALEFDAEGL